MRKGTLVVNLEPPYMGFLEAGDQPESSRTADFDWRNCSLEEIRDVLIELGAIAPTRPWPVRECILRIPIELPVSLLKKFDLGQLHTVEALKPHRDRVFN